MPSRELVPGDLIELKLGDIVPADAMLLEGQAVQVDQAALTGESLPVTIHPDGKVKQGSAVKRGEIKAVVCATGEPCFCVLCVCWRVCVLCVCVCWRVPVPSAVAYVGGRSFQPSHPRPSQRYPRFPSPLSQASTRSLARPLI